MSKPFTMKHATPITRKLPLLLLAFIPLSLTAQPSLESCATISSPAERLLCYDRAMEAGPSSDMPVLSLPRSDQRTQSAGQAQRDNAPPARAGGDDFGLEHKKDYEEDGKTRVYTVASARHNDFSGWTIEFENGQVWRQIGTDDYRIEVGKQYQIQRAMLNSFLLGNPDNNRKIRVTRVE